MFRAISLLTVTLALAACSTATSTVGFPAADVDDSDIISPAEFHQAFDDLDIFERTDDDDDTVLTRTEYNDGVDEPYDTDVYFRGLDRNIDGVLSRDEFINGWFFMFDVDRSEGLDRDEYSNAMESLDLTP